jgi:hypothetical protein
MLLPTNRPLTANTVDLRSGMKNAASRPGHVEVARITPDSRRTISFPTTKTVGGNHEKLFEFSRAKGCGIEWS